MNLLKKSKGVGVAFFLFFLIFSLSGCDVIYRILQKEGAEEKDLLGIVVPNEYNPRVARVQKLLKLYGYKVGKADGSLGANTRNAIEAFQKDNDLNPSRFLDYTTWETLSLFEEYGLLVDAELNIAGIQTALTEAGFAPGPIDGKPGRRTERAIIAFQKAEGLKPDGRVGMKTLQALAQYLPEPEE